jgi:hypothetical protein
MQIDANIIALSDPLAWKCLGNECHRWITLLHFNGLFINGSGTINGQGTNWWGLSCQQNKRVRILLRIWAYPEKIYNKIAIFSRYITIN